MTLGSCGRRAGRADVGQLLLSPGGRPVRRDPEALRTSRNAGLGGRRQDGAVLKYLQDLTAGMHQHGWRYSGGASPSLRCSLESEPPPPDTHSRAETRWLLPFATRRHQWTVYSQDRVRVSFAGSEHDGLRANADVAASALAVLICAGAQDTGGR